MPRDQQRKLKYL